MHWQQTLQLFAVYHWHMRSTLSKHKSRVSGSRLMTTFWGISLSWTAREMSLWNKNLSSSNNRAEGYTFPVVPFLLTQPIFFRICFAQLFLSSKLPPNSLRILGLFAFTTPLAMHTICRLSMTPPGKRVPIAISLTFFVKSSSNI